MKKEEFIKEDLLIDPNRVKIEREEREVYSIPGSKNLKAQYISESEVKKQIKPESLPACINSEYYY